MKKEAREKLLFDVFLSHNSKDKPAVRALAALLTERGIRVWLDEEQLVPGRPWQPLLEKGIKESATGTVLVGADGLGPWEDEEMQALLVFAVREKKPVIPVLLPGAPKEPDLPLFLANRGWVDLRAGFGTEGMDKLIWGITGEHPGRKPVPPRASEPIIAVTRLRHGADRLVGREKELIRLDTAWQDPKTHVVTIVAWGGVGKTALVVEWMAQMARDGWRGAERVFDWSFYSQGTREQGAASADTFIAKALEFVGDPEMAKSAAAAWDKGSRLAHLVAQKRTLLVLDGVEPLQYPPGAVGGQLKDPALAALLKGLAQHNPGLCIVTTRESVTDLKPYRDTTSPEWLLEHLSEEAGAHLLYETGVKRAGNARIRADDKELKDASREVGGHALTLQLLGRYLAKVHDGDVRKRDLVRFEKADAKVQGGHAFRVMAMYEKWLLGKGDEDALRQLAVLRLLGLFDRPADVGCLAALRQTPAIAGLTELLVGLDDDDWNYTLSDLAECSLVSLRDDHSPTTDNRLPTTILDAHPLIREYFAQQLREQQPDAWRAGHRRLYEHLSATTKEGDEPTLEDLQPLYQAVAHGCQAGLHQEAIVEIYWWRIQRKLAGYSHRCLGAFGAELAMLSAFFESGWTQPSRNLRDFWQANVLGFAAARFRSLGWLDDATRLFQASLKAHRCQADMWLAGTRARQLADTYTQMGRLAEAKEQAGEAVSLGDKAAALANDQKYLSRYEAEGFASITRDDVVYERVVQRVSLGGALRQMGQTRDAKQAFRLAERLQKRTWADLPVLFSIWGARYCRLLLDGIPAGSKSACGRYKRIVRRIGQMRRTRQRANKMKIPKGYWGLLEEALEQEVGALAKARLSLAQGRNVPLESLKEIDLAVESFHRTGRQDFICHGLLTRMALRCEMKDFAGVMRDLDEAWRIAERGPMTLDLADIYLYRARLFHAVTPYPWDKDEQGKPRGPKDDLAAARALIEQCGYGRRKEELGDAEEAIGIASKPKNGL